MSESERVLKQLGLNFETLVEDTAYEISPLDFLCKIKIILVETGNHIEMFIWNKKTNTELHTVELSFPGEIAHNYSFLYNFDKNNLKSKYGQTSSNEKV